jgi:uncharacterized membrane protein
VRTVGLRWLGLLGVAAALFVVLDLVWLTVVATSLYDRLLGDLLADEPNTAAAVGFYVLFLLGLTHFVIRPAVDCDSLALAARDGAFFGLVTYATWDLTNLAVIEAFPAALVPVDLAWGAFLAAAVSGGTVAVWRALTRRRARAGR